MRTCKLERKKKAPFILVVGKCFSSTVEKCQWYLQGTHATNLFCAHRRVNRPTIYILTVGPSNELSLEGKWM